jgi:hypothetical protein
LVDQGYCFKKLVFLGSERQLQDFERVGLPATVATEAQMMRYFHEQSSLHKRTDALFVNSLMKRDGEHVARPTTDDTFIDFLSCKEKPGTCLVISTNPYLARQVRVARYFLEPHSYTVEGAGIKADGTIDVIMLLDEFARLLYQEIKILEK